jgi:hypothetical protein
LRESVNWNGATATSTTVSDLPPAADTP